MLRTIVLFSSIFIANSALSSGGGGCGGCGLENNAILAKKNLPKEDTVALNVSNDIMAITYFYAKNILKLAKPDVFVPTGQSKVGYIKIDNNWESFEVQKMILENTAYKQ